MKTASKYGGKIMERIILMKENRKYYSMRKIAFYFIALILFISASAKVIDSNPLLETLNLIRIIPDETKPFIAAMIPIWEMALAIMIVLNFKKLLTLIAITVTFAAFLTLSVYYSQISPIDSDCGCFGNLVPSRFDIWMVIRNTFFFLISIGLLVDSYKSRNHKAETAI